MSAANNSGAESGKEKSLSEATVQTVPQNLTTIQSIQTVHNIQNVQNVSSNIQSLQTAQAITGQASTLVGKSISLELNSKLLMKPAISSNIGTSENKITSTFCPVGSTVRIIAPNMLSTIERQTQSQPQTSQQTQQIVTSIPSTYHVPRGPAAVASISTPRSTVATPLVRAINTGQPIPISRAGNSPTCGKPRAPAGGNSTSRVSDASTHKNAADFGKTVTICKSRDSQEHGTADVARTVSNDHSKIPLKKRSIYVRVNTTVANTQWQTKNTPVVYAQPQRLPVPVGGRPVVRSVATAVYTSQQQAQQQQTQQPQPQQQQPQPQQQQAQSQQPQQTQTRLVTPSPVGVVRPMQAQVLTPTSTRLIAPVLQAQNNNISRLPVPTRPATPQVVMSVPQVTQTTVRPVSQIQPNQTSRPMSTAPINRVAVASPVIGAPNRVATVTSVQAAVGRQLTINTVAGASPGTVSRIVIPQAIQQQQQQQQSQPGATRIVQAVTPLANFNQVSRVIATTSTNAGVAANVTRVAQTGPTSVTRITGMSLHSLPAALTPARATAPLKVTAQAPNIQTVQLKPATPTMQPQTQQSQTPLQQLQQQAQQPQQQPQLQGPVLQRAISTSANVVTTSGVVTSQQQQQPSQVQGQYLHPSPHSTTYYSIDASGTYSQYRPASMQPVRLLVEQGFDEPLGKPNASPRPSILRKRDVDSSPGKGIAKNLVPVLAALPASTSISSPPGSPKGDRDGGGNHSSGSTTVSATSSPGLDEEPEQSRITINTTVEMSPRKKPRKQQLTGVELTEPRCTDEEMQFIEEKVKKEFKEESRDKYGERKFYSNQPDVKPPTTPVKSKPSLCMIGNSWKNQYGGRLHHYKRPSDVKPRDDRKMTLNEIAQQKQVLQKIDGWKLHHLKTQLDDLAEVEKTVHKKLKMIMAELEPQRGKNKQDDVVLENINELIKGNMQRHSLVSEGLLESKDQLFATFKHKPYVRDLLQRNSNKRVQKKRDK